MGPRLGNLRTKCVAGGTAMTLYQGVKALECCVYVTQADYARIHAHCACITVKTANTAKERSLSKLRNSESADIQAENNRMSMFPDITPLLLVGFFSLLLSP